MSWTRNVETEQNGNGMCGWLLEDPEWEYQTQFNRYYHVNDNTSGLLNSILSTVVLKVVISREKKSDGK